MVMKRYNIVSNAIKKITNPLLKALKDAQPTYDRVQFSDPVYDDEGNTIYSDGDLDIVAGQLNQVLGTSVIGRGSYAIVIGAKNADYVLKIVRTNESANFLTYARYCRRNWRRNKHLLKVYHIVDVEFDELINGGAYSIIISEKLRLDTSKANKFHYQTHRAGSWNTGGEKKCPKSQLSFMAACDNVFGYLERVSTRRICTDIHDENVLFRGKIPVIVDPVDG